MNAEDAIEMILAGATAVSVGTANFTNPHVTEGDPSQESEIIWSVIRLPISKIWLAQCMNKREILQKAGIMSRFFVRAATVHQSEIRRAYLVSVALKVMRYSVWVIIKI